MVTSKNLVKCYTSVKICNTSDRKYSVFRMNVRSKQLPEVELLTTFYSKYRITAVTRFKSTHLLELIYL